MDELTRLDLLDDGEEEPIVPAESDAEASDQAEEGDTDESTPSGKSSTASLEELLDDQKRRNAGLQRKLLRESQARQELEQRLSQLEELLLQTSLAGLDPAERSARLVQFRRDRETQARLRRLAEDERLLEEKARALTIQEAARQAGLDPADLDEFSTPRDLSAALRLVQKIRGDQGSSARPEVRSAAAHRARSQPRDARGRFESVAPSRAPAKEPEDLEEAAALFRERARRLGLY